jgi:hypothetical protein
MQAPVAIDSYHGMCFRSSAKVETALFVSLRIGSAYARRCGRLKVHCRVTRTRSAVPRALAGAF